MAIGRTAWRPRIDYPPIRFVRFTGLALTEGIERHRIEGIDVAITDPARTIVDCFRYRTKVGIDVAMEGLREGLRQRKATSDQLWRYATKARVWSIMKPYVEATVAAVPGMRHGLSSSCFARHRKRPDLPHGAQRDNRLQTPQFLYDPVCLLVALPLNGPN